MEGVVSLLKDVADKFPLVAIILGALGCLVIVAQAVVVMTPSRKDDELLDAVQKNSIGGLLLKALVAFAPIQKK